MGKKVDLNAPRKTNKKIQNKSNRFRSVTSSQNTTTNDFRKKIAAKVMASQGVPEELTNLLLENEKFMKFVKKLQKYDGLRKSPMMLVPLIIAAVAIIILMLFVALSGDSNGSAAYGNFKYGTTCTTVTVTDTGCDGDASNCSHAYDGDVSFEDYIAGVVAAEVGGANNLEYYKVAAISARTYFLNHVSDSCTVPGNATFQAYMDVDDSANAELIKQAVEETESLVLVADEDLSSVYYASACVVNADDEYYYIRYGTRSLGEANFQKIPKEWDQRTDHAYSGYLAAWYKDVDQSNTDLENKSCPNNHDYGMSQLGALYLITEENYSYEDVIEFYYGETSEIMKNEMQLSGVNGFINPVRKIDCRSAYGMRLHPVHKVWKKHNGIDLGGMPEGEPIYAAKSGTVISVTKDLNIGSSGYGNYVIIDHGDGTSTVYAHMAYGTIPDTIYDGATVSQGEYIGGVGTTGTSTGNHLHYEVRINNSKVDPADYIDWTDGIDRKSCH